MGVVNVGDPVTIKHGANTALELVAQNFDDPAGLTGTVTHVDPSDLWPYRVALEAGDCGFYPRFYALDELEVVQA